MSRAERPQDQNDEPSDDEAALIQAARGDPAAFGRLYARYVDRVYTYLRLRLGAAGVDDVGDLTQQVFLRALNALPRYEPRAGVSVGAWLLRIARNAATDWQRQRRPAIPWEAVHEDQQPVAPDTAESAALRADERVRIQRMLAILDEQTREAILLRFTAQLTLAEIGALQGSSEEAARKRITRALHALKERFHDDTL
ncbi:MAG TPA: RNA polymerase sigma factor [Ktedonobacterales bacterium]|nr:RNA polymerase sigma factor [Ktedonobacterales bacterium]